jgi:hypothetical protein
LPAAFASATLSAWTGSYTQIIRSTDTPPKMFELQSGIVTDSVWAGTFTAPPLGFPPGEYTITISSCFFTGSQPTSLVFDLYIDPSGVVRDTFHLPLVGATVTLYRSDDAGGPFVVVPNGSAIMSPLNRTNPDLTAAGGQFGWDVIEGFYKVRAEKGGCAAPDGGGFVETTVLTIPPPVTNLELVLHCPAAPADLIALVESMHLDRGLANELASKARQAATRVGGGKNACKPLDDFARRVVDEAGNAKPKLTGAQARALLNELYAVEFTDGCRALGSTLPEAEAAVVDLIDVINGLGLPKGLTNNLRNKASEAGKQAATGVGDPCRRLDELLRTATAQLTPPQLAELTAEVSAVQSGQCL